MNGETIKQSLCEMGFHCELKKSIISPRFEIYYFDLDNPLLINHINQKTINVLQDIYKRRFFLERPIDYSFSIGLEHSDFNLNFEDYTNYRNNDQRSVYIGVDLENKPVCLDFANTINHILVGGATGSGKSTLLNSMILNIVSYCGVWNNASPFVFLFDPKKVEFARYKGTDGFYYESDNQAIADKLSWLVSVMETRYKEFVDKGFVDYKQANYQPYYVFIDELADLMMCGIDTIEQDIIRLAQKGRGAGIHLILATQNPIAKVCTSLIKSNMTTRIALKCATKMQSIVVLDHIGAEKLLGKGDAILKLPNKVDEIRFQCAYCSDELIDKAIKQRNEIARVYRMELALRGGE